MFTKTGPQSDDDKPRRRFRLLEWLERRALIGRVLYSPFGARMYDKVSGVESQTDGPTGSKNDRGLPEAELTPAEEEWARKRVARQWHRDE